MKKVSLLLLALLAGYIGGYLLLDIFIKFSMQLFGGINVPIIGILSQILPLGGAITAFIVVYLTRFAHSKASNGTENEKNTREG